MQSSNGISGARLLVIRTADPAEFNFTAQHRSCPFFPGLPLATPTRVPFLYTVRLVQTECAAELCVPQLPSSSPRTSPCPHGCHIVHVSYGTPGPVARKVHQVLGPTGSQLGPNRSLQLVPPVALSTPQKSQLNGTPASFRDGP